MNPEKNTGYSTSSEALEYYLSAIVNPALENFDRIGSQLFATTGVSRSQMLGRPLLTGGNEFTDSCKRMLDKFFETHHALTERQQALVQTVTRFRDNLQQSDAAYIHTEAEATQSLTNLVGRLETRLDTDGATG
ncbi:hypothetical protein [Actinokineospora sp.]|uniref:hypothetical protein n=1 Tax=Actinokineospora sp. TaxID=1872133 RepID=UPI003D69FF48